MQQLDDVGNPNAPYGSREWCAAVRFQVRCKIGEAKSRVSHLKFDLKALRDEAHYAVLQRRDGQLFESWEEFCDHPEPEGLGFPADVANALIKERDGSRLVSAVAAEVMANAPARAGQGTRTDLEPLSNGKKLKGGNNQEYLAARIKERHPDIAAAVERGEFRSIRAAALAAGIVRQKTPIEHLRAWWRKANADERAEFRAEIETV